MSARHRAAGLIMLALLVALSNGCRSARPVFGQGSSEYSEQDLREDLASFSSEFSAVVDSTGLQIADEASSRTVRRAALLWRVAVCPLVREAAFQEDPQAAYVTVLGYVVLTRQYLTDGDGKDLFGTNQPLAIAATRQLEARALDIGDRFLDDQQFADLKVQVETLALEHPIRGAHFSVEPVHRLARDAQVANAFAWLIDIPMSPFSALQAVGNTASAVREFTESSRAFTAVVNGLPRQLRLQLELLLYDLEDRDTVMQALAAFETLAGGTQALLASLDRLPAEMRATLEGTGEELEQARAALAEARSLAEALGPTSAQLADASASWERILTREKKQPTAGQERRPFDVTEWESAALQIGTSAAELRGLADELGALLDPQRLEATFTHVDQTLQDTEAGATSVVDAAFVRALQLLLAFFGLLVMTRLITARLARRAGPATR